jgi:hypothetical protein
MTINLGNEETFLMLSKITSKIVTAARRQSTAIGGIVLRALMQAKP